MPAATLKTTTAPTEWRQQVLDVALNITSVLFPVVFAVLALTRRRDRIDAYISVLAVLIVVVLAMRFSPQLGFRMRAATLVAVLQIAGIDAIASSGLLPGSGMAALISVALCVIFFGRRAMFAVLMITPLAYLVIGSLVASGQHILRLDDANPLVYAHWVRVAAVIGLLSGLLGSAVAYVVTHVENSYGAAVKSSEALLTAYNQLGMLHRRLELAKEEERSALARELHDQMGQTLTVLKLRLQLLFRNAAAATPAQTGELLELVDGLISHVRKISLNLRPTFLDEMGLEPALGAFIESQARHSGLQITLDARDIAQRFAPEVEQASFRIVQEAVTNALRHAQATQVHVRVWHETGGLKIEIEDDGVGFSPEEAAAKAQDGHLGIVGMRERTRLLGGELKLGKAAEVGTRVHASLPSTPPAAPITR